MKAACVLLCLAIGASANILRHQLPTDALDLQEWHSINQQSERQRNSEHQDPNQKDQWRAVARQQLQDQDEHPRRYNSQQQTSASQEERRNAQTLTLQKPQAHRRNIHQHTDAVSSESTQNTRVMTEKFTSQQNQVGSTNEKNIMWRGVQMPVGQHALFRNKEDIERVFGDAHQAIKHITDEDKLMLNEVYEDAQNRGNQDVQMNATQLAQEHQYYIEEHTITTDDGYILTMFRIPAKNQILDVPNNKVAFLMHDILGSADDWLLMGPGKSLAYLLSDDGYDVWLGNARGNKYSQNHVSKHPAVSDFWQFSIDEIALHDLPAMIDYVLKTTQQQKLQYVAHGQGATVFFALTAAVPEYNDKVIMMFALAPMVYMTNVRSPLFRMIAPTSKIQHQLETEIGNAAFVPSQELIKRVGGAMLQNEIGNKKVSSNVNFVLSGFNVDGIDADLIPVVMGHLPAGTSSKVIKHFGQIVASNQFRRYDYGPHINEMIYGQQDAPIYNMENVKTPVTVFYSEEDWLAHPEDVARLQKVLPDVRESYKVPEQHFSHMDFQFSTSAPALVYKQLIVSMNYQQYTYSYI